MADKTEFLQAIDDAILDADSLKRFINGDDTQTVLTRLNAQYPTLQKAIKELFENVGVAGRFKTLALLQASSLPDGSYALVADDADDKNGIYIKDGGVWAKSKYDISTLKNKLAMKTSVNVFNYPELTQKGAVRWQSVNEVEGGEVLLVLRGGVQATYYEQPIDGKKLVAGKPMRFGVDAFCDTAGADTCDVSLQFVTAEGTHIKYTFAVYPTEAGKWVTLVTETDIPANAAKVIFRLTKRAGSTVAKFKNAYAVADNNAIVYQQQGSSNISTVKYVAKSGNDFNDGSKDAPLLTIQKAVNLLPNGGEVVVLDGAEYREAIRVETNGHVTIRGAYNKRVNLFGSDILNVTKTSGFTKVYQAPLALEPKGVVGNGMIAEWGTPSKPIAAEDRHPLHRGKTHRLPYTALSKVGSKAEVEQNNGSWYWESGIVYFSATDGGDATKKRYEGRVREVFYHTNGSIKLINVTSWFSSFYGFSFKGASTERINCEAYGSRHNGFADNANATLSINDIAGGTSNDGFNGTLDVPELSEPEQSSRAKAVYIEPYAHDNSDDGMSCHYRSDYIVFGGLFENNGNSNITHVTGANCTCYNTVAQNSLYGFYANSAPSLDTERVITGFMLVNTYAKNVTIGYRVGNDAFMVCRNTIAENPLTFGYMQTGTGIMTAIDARYIGDESKMKSGNISIKNSVTVK